MNAIRRHPVWTALGVLVLALIVLVLLFDWNWVRPPIERYITKKTGREFHASSLDVKLGMNPTIRLDNLQFANAPWGDKKPMAAVKKLEFQVSLRDLFDRRVLIPRVAISGGDFLMERDSEGRKNWTLSDPNDKSPSHLRISTLSVDQGHLRYVDHGMPFELDVDVNTFDPAQQGKVQSADAAPSNRRYSTRYEFQGKYHDASFAGTALTGEVFSFQESNQLFPIKGSLKAGTTRLDLEGSVADVVNISAIDVTMRMAGQTMANIYPFLLLPLPATPPYEISGRLKYGKDRYEMDDLKARIGSTDVHGQAAYVKQKPRPLLTADLHSDTINLADLGPLIGIRTEAAKGKPRLTQAETNTRAQAAQGEQVRNQDRVLPAGSFEGSRFKAIDADVNLETHNLKANISLPVESLRASLQLHDALLKLTPLDVGFAGGTIASQVTLDAR
ncbi:MAG TPA: AsmA family protein, partial [Burkholderiales bacterium]|nr:AsmA family protein [Burkholderiales bacterium]